MSTGGSQHHCLDTIHLRRRLEDDEQKKLNAASYVIEVFVLDRTVPIWR
jgi:hypothetical protein